MRDKVEIRIRKMPRGRSIKEVKKKNRMKERRKKRRKK